MNPATDAGKRELPAALRNRFTELWVPEPSQREDLRALVHSYLAGVGGPTPPVDAVVDFYLAAKAEAVSVGKECVCGVGGEWGAKTNPHIPNVEGLLIRSYSCCSSITRMRSLLTRSLHVILVCRVASTLLWPAMVPSGFYPLVCTSSLAAGQTPLLTPPPPLPPSL